MQNTLDTVLGDFCFIAIGLGIGLYFILDWLERRKDGKK